MLKYRIKKGKNLKEDIMIKNSSRVDFSLPETNGLPRSLRSVAMTKAFTLAEVLITLGIIGIVAAMTLPALITKYQKHVTVNRLKHAYSVLSQAVKLSEVSNGSIDDWDWSAAYLNSEALEIWLKQYMCPYMKYTEISNSDSEKTTIKIANGTTFTFKANSETNIHVFVQLSPKNQERNTFVFLIQKGLNNRHLVLNKSGVWPYSYSATGIDTNTRAFWKDNTSYGCNRNGKKYLCAGLIMYDGWQIKDDYPW